MNTQNTGLSHRAVATGAAWTVPAVAVAASAPAVAASLPTFAIACDGGSGYNGYANNMYVNLGSSDGSTGTLPNPIVVTIDVVGLNTTATTERNFVAGSSLGSVTRSAYNPATRTTTLTWTIPAGTAYDSIQQGNIDLLIQFRDGGLTNRITNKVVVTSVTGATLESGVPLDSSVVKDINPGALSPDGIY